MPISIGLIFSSYEWFISNSGKTLYFSAGMRVIGEAAIST